MSPSDETSEMKRKLRHDLRQRRRQQSDKDELSRELFQQFFELSLSQTAQVVLYYVDVRDEVRTRATLGSRLEQSQRVVVPYCHGDSLALVELRSFSELSSGAYGILEPTSAIKADMSRVIHPESVDIALIPGVGFDETGARLGHGKGYYDRLLPLLRDDCTRIGIAFDCQLVEQIPVSEHDQCMDMVLTPTRLIECERS